MRQQDHQIVGVDQCALWRAAEEETGMAHEVLIQGRGSGDEDRHRCLGGAPGAASLLPGGGNGARIAGHHTCGQLPNVNAQFQRIGGYHAPHFSLPQSPLYLPPLGRQVPASIAPHLLPHPLAQVVAQIAQQDLGGEPGTGEYDGLQTRIQEALGDHAGLQNW